jgi:transposase InsO family protein
LRNGADSHVAPRAKYNVAFTATSVIGAFPPTTFVLSHSAPPSSSVSLTAFALGAFVNGFENVAVPDTAHATEPIGECLSMEWFRNRHEAVPIIESWRQHYNEVRPHSSLDYLTPIEFKTENSKTTTQPTEVDSP